jgi:hypothetical protein
MDYKNGYKVAYEVAADGKRAIYAATTNSYPTRNEEGIITDDLLAKFEDVDFRGKTVYEDKTGNFFVADTNAAKFDENGTATGVALADLNKKEKTLLNDGEGTGNTENGTTENGNTEQGTEPGDAVGGE